MFSLAPLGRMRELSSEQGKCAPRGRTRSSKQMGLRPTAQLPREVDLNTPTGILYGSLETPASSTSPPVILIISGSGPTDRDGNIQGLQGKNNSLKYLAEALTRKGVASLRFDKRGIGKSASSAAREEELRFETYIDDVIAWVNYLKQQGKYSECLIL